MSDDWLWWITAGVLIVAAVYFAVRDRPSMFTDRYVANMVLSAACAVAAALCVLAGAGVAP